MKTYTFVAPDGGIYQAPTKRGQADVAIPESPGAGYIYDQESMSWQPDYLALKKHFEQLIQQRLDEFAGELYDDMQSACSYKGSSVKEWNLEGSHCFALRDATWKKAYQLFNDFRPEEGIPTWAEIQEKLPALTWPQGSRGYKD